MCCDLSGELLSLESKGLSGQVPLRTEDPRDLASGLLCSERESSTGQKGTRAVLVCACSGAQRSKKWAKVSLWEKRSIFECLPFTYILLPSVTHTHTHTSFFAMH